MAIVILVCLALLSAGLTWWINRPKTEVEAVDLAVEPGMDRGFAELRARLDQATGDLDQILGLLNTLIARDDKS